MFLSVVVCSLLVVSSHICGSLSQQHQTKPNNVCPTFDDYYTIKNNTKCWYDFSAEYTAYPYPINHSLAIKVSGHLSAVQITINHDVVAELQYDSGPANMFLSVVVCSLLVVSSHICGSLSQQHQTKPNNVCPTFDDYYTIKNNTKCWYDFSAEYTAPEIIRLNGFTVIEYKVTTADGYILTLFRIPSDNVKNPKAKSHPIYLQHGLVATCANFLGNRRNSLALVLADAGYDVWLGNYRGNQYSEGHVNLTIYDQEYWDHSMDEVALFDFPTIFHTILKYTGANNKIIYIGHSLGTTLALMYAAEFPEQAKQLFHLFVLISPAYTLSNMKSPYKSVAPFGPTILDTVRSYRMMRLASQAMPLQNLVREYCLESPESMRLCFQLYNLFYGPNTLLGPEIIPVYFNQLPGGTSLKILSHAAALVENNFRKYDYGPKKNLERYGSHLPPEYDIRKIHVPVHLIYSTQDWATTEAEHLHNIRLVRHCFLHLDEQDAWNLYRNLPEEARYGLRKIDLPKFNHVDFIFGRTARKVVYEPLVEFLNAAIDS